MESLLKELTKWKDRVADLERQLANMRNQYELQLKNQGNGLQANADKIKNENAAL